MLLATGEQARILRTALAQNRKVAIDGFDVLGDAVAILACVSAHQQVVVHAQQREHFAPLGHMAQALLHDVGRVLCRDVIALELNRSLARIDDARDGF